MAFTSLGWSEDWPCADGSPCTDGYCIGSPLPGMGGAGLDIAPEGAGANAGKCSQFWLEGICPNGKPWDPYSCKVVGCPKNSCGTQMICNLVKAGGTGACTNPVGPAGYAAPACQTDNPCVNVGCVNGECYYSPVYNSTPCGAFKHCKDGKCVAID